MSRYPIYVISKGRYENPLTAIALEAINADFRIVIEPQEESHYKKTVDHKKILVLPFANLGLGSIPARNWVWEHSVQGGHERHWILDDNIRHFFRLTGNTKYRMTTPVCFDVIEDFVDRYTNVPIAGMQYTALAVAKNVRKPICFNTRIYSCILLSNFIKERWRGRYNEDTDLSIRLLKKGMCSALFLAFTANKMATLTMKGGNTEELYKQTATFDGRLAMARSLQQQHPDIVTIKKKWNRWQHVVDYRGFKKNKLIRKAGLSHSSETNEYGMKLVRKGV